MPDPLPLATEPIVLRRWTRCHIIGRPGRARSTGRRRGDR